MIEQRDKWFVDILDISNKNNEEDFWGKKRKIHSYSKWTILETYPFATMDNLDGFVADETTALRDNYNH